MLGDVVAAGGPAHGPGAHARAARDGSAGTSRELAAGDQRRATTTRCWRCSARVAATTAATDGRGAAAGGEAGSLDDLLRAARRARRCGEAARSRRLPRALRGVRDAPAAVRPPGGSVRRRATGTGRSSGCSWRRTGQEWLDEWYAGRPFIVNANDHGLRLWNGDTGVAVPRRRRDGEARSSGSSGTRVGGPQRSRRPGSPTCRPRTR